jgi:hypothetical protein
MPKHLSSADILTVTILREELILLQLGTKIPMFFSQDNIRIIKRYLEERIKTLE